MGSVISHIAWQCFFSTTKGAKENKRVADNRLLCPVVTFVVKIKAHPQPYEKLLIWDRVKLRVIFLFKRFRSVYGHRLV